MLVTAIASYDSDLKFFPNGKQFTYDVKSPVLGRRTLPTTITIPGTTGYKPTASMLVVKTTDYGDLYLNMTVAAYVALLQAASKSAAPAVITKFYTITGTQSSITDTALANATILVVEKNGTVENFTGTYSPAGVLTISVVANDVVGVTYYTN